MSTSIHTGTCVFIYPSGVLYCSLAKEHVTYCHIQLHPQRDIEEVVVWAQKYWMDGKNILHCILILQCWFRLARDEEMLTATMIRFVEEPRFKMEISQDGHKRVKVKA